MGIEREINRLRIEKELRFRQLVSGTAFFETIGVGFLYFRSPEWALASSAGAGFCYLYYRSKIDALEAEIARLEKVLTQGPDSPNSRGRTGVSK